MRAVPVQASGEHEFEAVTGLPEPLPAGERVLWQGSPDWRALAREAFHLPAIAFTDRELASLQTALSLLDGKFAYAEPLRLALQQISWGRPSPLSLPSQRTVGLGITASAGGHEVSQRIAKSALPVRSSSSFEAPSGSTPRI